MVLLKKNFLFVLMVFICLTIYNNDFSKYVTFPSTYLNYYVTMNFDYVKSLTCVSIY
jgi:hypothetical protein